MKSFTLVVQPDEAGLLIGGQTAPQQGGNRATARDLKGRPVVPASALRGALRVELERLLTARDGAGTVCSANEPLPDRGDACPCAVCRLFGREEGTTGTLRLEDARMEGVADPVGQLRNRAAVSRRTGTVVDRHLGFVETTELLGDEESVSFRASGHLVPRGSQDSGASLAEDLANLKAACAAIRFIGGGKAHGLGWVRCSLEEIQDAPVPKGSPLSTPVTGLKVTFEACAPLHFGRSRPIGTYLASQRHARGSTVRGALAFALLERGLVEADEEIFQRLCGVGGGPTFGSARVSGHLPCTTRRRCRPVGHVVDDLVVEVLRRHAARAELALAIRGSSACPHTGCKAVKLMPWPYRAEAAEPVTRVRTRTALNRRTGTGMDQKLFSIEALEPWMRRPGKDGEERLQLTAEICALDSESAALLARLDGCQLWLGGKRSRGMGLCRVHLQAASEPDSSTASRACEELTAALEEGWKALRSAAPILPETFLSAGEVALALVLSEPWSPGELGESAEVRLGQGPLAEAKLLAGFVELTEEGRFGAKEARWYSAPESVLQGEQPPMPVAAAGSVYVYSVTRDQLERDLPSWVRRGWEGGGLNRELGWGRFLVRGPQRDF